MTFLIKRGLTDLKENVEAKAISDLFQWRHYYLISEFSFQYRAALSSQHFGFLLAM